MHFHPAANCISKQFYLAFFSMSVTPNIQEIKVLPIFFSM